MMQTLETVTETRRLTDYLASRPLRPGGTYNSDQRICLSPVNEPISHGGRRRRFAQFPHTFRVTSTERESFRAQKCIGEAGRDRRQSRGNRAPRHRFPFPSSPLPGEAEAIQGHVLKFPSRSRAFALRPIRTDDTKIPLSRFVSRRLLSL